MNDNEKEVTEWTGADRGTEQSFGCLAVLACLLLAVVLIVAAFKL